MSKMRLIWVDVGMAIMVGVFIVVVVFLRGEDYFVPVLFGYGVAVMVWAFLAESVASRVERRKPAQGMDRLAQRDPRTKLPI